MSSATAAPETPAYVEGPSGPIFAIVTSPPQATRSVILCPGGWHAGNSNSNRLLMRLAQRLASTDSASVRFDWEGTGESPGSRHSFVLDNPSPGEPLAVAQLVRTPQAIAGICFGSRSALAAAPDLPHLESIVLASFPLPAARAKTRRAERVGTLAAIREGLRPAAIKGWFDPATRRVYKKFISLRWQKLRAAAGLGRNASVQASMERKSQQQAFDIGSLIAQLEELVKRNVRVLFVFGTGDALYDEFSTACEGPLGSLLRNHPDLLKVSVIDGDMTGFSTLAVQDDLIDIAVPWLSGGTD
jgi:hypothetical protein